ncbi:MAG: hypothetical protein HYX34_04495 [Actinobacteria bacterium]|nr:hypothetical protein [Actinomycetota bacterium]
MRIRAYSVFEGVVYHCWPVDRSNPCRPTLEVEAVLREGDADEAPLLVTVADYVSMIGDPTLARACLEQLARRGRIVRHLGVDHLTFPFWTPIEIGVPGAADVVRPAADAPDPADPPERPGTEAP